MEFKDVRNALAQVAEHYHVQQPPAQWEALRDLARKLLHWLNNLIQRSYRHSGNSIDSRSMSAALQFVVVLCAIAALLAGVVLLVRRAGRFGSEQARSTKGAATIEMAMDAYRWRQKAEQLARGQDYKAACRALYLSLLQSLDENGIAAFAPTKTNREYGYALSAHPQLKERFKHIADLVESVWFGGQEAREREYGQSAAWLDELGGDISRLKARSGDNA